MSYYLIAVFPKIKIILFLIILNSLSLYFTVILSFIISMTVFSRICYLVLTKIGFNLLSYLIIYIFSYIKRRSIQFTSIKKITP